MNNELLNKIIPYIGHETYAYDEEQETKMDLIVGFFGNTLDFHEWSPCDSRIDKYKLILFPPDCLTREIETEYGKEIPLIEIAKIAFPYASKWEIKNNCAVSGIVLVSMNENGSISVHRITSSDGYTSPNETYNQWQLFQYLYSRHIAFNLEPDKYVNVESLEKNPYADHSKR